MSDQEMQFADPEWQPPRQRSRDRQQAPYAPVDVNDAPYQQKESQTASRAEDEETGGSDYSRGYRAEQPGFQSFQDTPEFTAQKPRKKLSNRSWTLLVAIVLAILIFNPVGEDTIFLFWRVLLVIVAVGAIFTIFGFIKRGRNITSATETHTFSVGAQPKIIIKDDIGSIRVHPGGEEYQVIVQAIKRKRILMGGDIEVDCSQNIGKNSITVKASNGWSFIGSKWVDFDITVPRNVDLELKIDAGSITVGGIAGQMTCITDAGTVKVTDAWLRGNSKLKTDAGTINFSGALDPTGSYQMSTDAGTVSVTLPPQASFHLDAKTDVGSINSDFPLDIQRDFPGSKARCDIGLPPYSALKLRADVGSINIRQGQG